jgi:5-methylcytosine-specific restriction endonuclease McrA
MHHLSMGGTHGHRTNGATAHTAMNPAYNHPAYKANRLACLIRDQWRCHWCGRWANTADHYPTPLAHGGSHELENLVASCRVCNSRGGAKITNDLKAGRIIGRRSRIW